MNEYRKRLLESIGITLPENEIENELWHKISGNKKLSEEFIREFESKLTWVSICKHQILSEKIMCEFINKVSWHYISRNQKLSEGFIRDHQYNLNWVAISAFQQLTDDFLIEFKDKIDWRTYFRYQVANFDIMNAYILKSNFDNMKELKVSHFTNEQKKIINKKLTLKYLFKNKRPK